MSTLILLVIYLLTTAGAILLLLFVKRRMPVPVWHLDFPIGALAYARRGVGEKIGGA
ncbi:hypothetical protein OHS18_43000 [Amycolatopsis sp. NBC_00355]|uniref:hypothetical protein n=1 Tax=Amycolatopsis sp. NBC_00355 TaxID=2975957 RepID=UPI002E25D864